MTITSTKFAKYRSAGTWKWCIPQPTRVKKFSGLYDRSGAPDQNSSVPSAMWPYLDGYVIQSVIGVPGGVSWAELQPYGNNTPLVTTAIDQAVAHVRQFNPAQSLSWKLILRVMGGIYAPAWAQALDGAAFVNLGGTQVTNSITPQVGHNGSPGVIATGSTVTNLWLHSVPSPGFATNQYIGVVDSSGNVNSFQITQSVPQNGGYQSVTATGTDTYGWASDSSALSANVASTALAATQGLPEVYGNGITGFSGTTTIGQWWTTNYLAAVKQFYTKLAAYVETIPEIVLVTDMCCMTTFCEPCDKTGWNDPANSQAIVAAGWTLALEAAQQKAMYDFLPTVFLRTPTAKSFNPYSALSATVDFGYVINPGNTVGTVDGYTPDAAFGTDMLTYGQVTAPGNQASLARGQIILENNSLRGTAPSGSATPAVVYPAGSVVPVYSGDSWMPTYGPYTDSYDSNRGGTYTALYEAVAGYGKGNARTLVGTYPTSGYRYPSTPSHYQTATASTMGGIANLNQTLAYAAWLGARSVELPSTYWNGLSTSGGASSQMAFYRNAILANL